MLGFVLLSHLTACAEPAPVWAPPPEPTVEANGLPATYNSCLRQRALATASIADVFFDCRDYLVSHMSFVRASQEEKAALLDQMQTPAMNAAQEAVARVHGAAARF